MLVKAHKLGLQESVDLFLSGHRSKNSIKRAIANAREEQGHKYKESGSSFIEVGDIGLDY